MRQALPNFFPHRRAVAAAGGALLFLLFGMPAHAQASQTSGTSQTGASSSTGSAPAQDEAPAPPKKRRWIQRDDPEESSSAPTAPKKVTKAPAEPKKDKVAKDDRVVQSKDTRAELRKERKYNPLIGKDASLPDKQLYDKALEQQKKGHFDVARLDLQTLLSTYPESQYLMRAKLAVADTWFREGGSAAMAQAEQEYGDFITFFPNAPEAAEAQMRMGDIYLKQMDVPDRDYAKAIKAETQYRTMLKTYPDAPKTVLTEATQKLRDVQEVLAQREFDLGQFYASHANYPAAIARFQTVADTYPLFSHMDDTLLGIGDSYEAEARVVRAQTQMPEGPRARLEQEYDGKAAAAYRQVVLEHAAAPHAEDAKERLAGMNLPVPQPTAQQVAASDALEGSRAQYTMRKRLELLLIRKPDTVTAAQLGAPPLEDAQPTVAPTIVHQIEADYTTAFNPGAPAAAQPAKDAAAASADNQPAPAQPTAAPAGAGAPLTLSDVGNATGGERSTGTVDPAPAGTTGGTGTSVGGGGAALGVDVLTPGAMTGGAISNRATDAPAATGKPDANYGIRATTKPDTTPLPAAEAPTAAPDAVNEAQSHPQPAAETKKPGQKKNPKPTFDKNDESSSKHPKKKGADKLNPF